MSESEESTLSVGQKDPVLRDLACAVPLISQWRTLPTGQTEFDRDSPGSGFFISNGGLFVTAKHVVADASGAILPALSLSRFHKERILRYILEPRMIAVHPEFDVAIGFAAIEVDVCLAVGVGSLEPGEHMFTYGFGDSDVPERDLEDGRSEIEVSLWPRVYAGAIEEFHERAPHQKGRGSPIYTHTLYTPAGISGGPLIRTADEAVYGVNCASFAGVDDYGWSVSLAQIVDWPLAFIDGRTLRHLSLLEGKPVTIR